MICTESPKDQFTSGLMSVPEAARMLHVSSRHLYALISRGDLAAVRLGGRVLIARATVHSIINAASKAYKR